MTAAERYRQVVLAVLAVRADNGGEDSDREDALLDEADDLWWQMTDEERELENRLAEQAVR